MARHRVNEGLVREWKLAHGVPAAGALAWPSTGLGEAEVHERAAPAGDPVEHAVDHAVARLALVEPEMDEVAHHPARQREAMCVDRPH